MVDQLAQDAPLVEAFSAEPITLDVAPIGKDERNCGSGATCRTSSRPWERGSWVGAGLLSTLYHVFEAPVVYPAFLGGLGLAGLWALRRNLWPCLLLHALFTASG